MAPLGLAATALWRAAPAGLSLVCRKWFQGTRAGGPLPAKQLPGHRLQRDKENHLGHEGGCPEATLPAFS